MTYQTWLKNLKKLKRTWMPRRSPPAPEARSRTAPLEVSSRASSARRTRSLRVTLQSPPSLHPARPSSTHRGPPVKNCPHVSDALTSSLAPASRLGGPEAGIVVLD